MRRGTLTLLLFIVLLAACSAYIDWPTNPHWSIGSFTLPHPDVKQGLDLQGGVRVVLVPDPAQHYSQSTIQTEIDPARNLIGTRVNGGLGVNEPNIYVQNSSGQYGIVVELPGLTSGNTSQQIHSLLQTGNLEFWNTGPQPVAIGSTFDPSQYRALPYRVSVRLHNRMSAITLPSRWIAKLSSLPSSIAPSPARARSPASSLQTRQSKSSPSCNTA